MASPTVLDLADQVADLTARIVALEAFEAEHRAGAATRQAEIDAVRADLDRARWVSTLRGRR